MKRAAMVLCALMLAGCNFIPGSNSGNDVAANDSSNVTAAQSSGRKDPVQAADAGVTRSRSLQAMSNGSADAGDKPQAAGADLASLIVGRWTDDGDCSRDSLIRPDGTFRTIEGEEARWRLEGNELTIYGPDLAIHVHIEFADPNTLVVTQANGTRGRSTRC